MGGHSAGGLAGLWSRLAHAHVAQLAHLRAPLDGHGFVSHLHDVGLSALAGAIILLGVVILLELRSLARLRHVTDRSLERVFEQLDLLRFETQALLEERRESREAGMRRNAEAESAARTLPQAAPLTASARRAAPPVAAAAAPAVPAVPNLPRAPILHAARVAEPAAAAPGRELADRRNLSSGEARLLSSLAEARARRVAAV